MELRNKVNFAHGWYISQNSSILFEVSWSSNDKRERERERVRECVSERDIYREKNIDEMALSKAFVKSKQ